jgi:chaperonin GroES
MDLALPHKPVSWLIANIDKPNLAVDLDEHTLQRIGADVVAMYDFDEASRSEWREKIEAGLKTAKQVCEPKTFPWPDAANTKDSLMSEAAAQFCARAGGEVLRGQDVVKVKVSGEDSDGKKEARAKRVSQYMSWDCTDGMDEWESENDQLLTSVSLIGMYYKKTYYDSLLGRNVSLSRSPLNIVVHEQTKCLTTAHRITDDALLFTPNQVQERIRSGLWLDISDKLATDDTSMPEQFLEQHRSLDLDGDGYEEPYAVTVHHSSLAVCRIVARYDQDGIMQNKKGEVVRIEPVHYFTEFPFLRSPDGQFHKIGWAHLLGPNTETVNTIVNQLLDAGTLANVPPVFVGKGAKLPKGGLKTYPGKMTPVECVGSAIRDNIYIPDLIGPSDVLFRLLSLLNEKGQKLANLSDSMQGESGGPNVPATTTLALLDQALKVYTSILKRLFRAYREEFQKLYRLDAKHLTDKQYINVLDITPDEVKALGIDMTQIGEGSRVLVEHDFSVNDKDISPVMDPTASSEALRLARLNAMAQAARMPPAVGRLYLEGIGCTQKDITAIFGDPNAPPPPNPAMLKLQADITQMQHAAQLKDKELALKHAEIEQKESIAVYTIEKLKAEIVNLKASSIKTLADAEAAEVGTQISAYQAEMDQLNTQTEQDIARIAAQEENIDGAGESGRGNAQPDGGGAPPMAGAPDNTEGAGVLPEQAAPGGGNLGGGELPPQLLGGGGNVDAPDGSGMPGVQPHADPQQLPQPGPMQ